jgi:hypothetical protein
MHDEIIPDYGTPPPTTGSPSLTATGWGQPRVAVYTVLVLERRRPAEPDGFDLVTVDDVPLGSVLRQTTVTATLLGGVGSTSYQIVNPQGSTIGAMLRPGTLGRSRFFVTDGGGSPAGVIEQQNLFGSPHLLLTAADDSRFRLRDRAGDGIQWRLTDLEDESLLLGRVYQDYPGAAGSTDCQRFAVQLSPELLGAHRLLTVLATIGLDYLNDARRH